MSSSTSGLVEEIRARRDAKERDSAVRTYKRQASRRDRELADAAKAGEAEGRRSERERSSKKRPPSKKRATSAKRRSSGRRVARTGARQVVVPLQRDAVSAVRSFMLTLVVVGIYLFLDNASAVGGFLGGISRGLEWLRAPDRAVPAKE